MLTSSRLLAAQWFSRSVPSLLLPLCLNFVLIPRLYLQVLFQSRYPDLSSPPNVIYVSSDGSVVKRDRVAAVRYPEEYGPHLRGWREARTIFTSWEEASRRDDQWELDRGRDGPGHEPMEKPPRPRGRRSALVVSRRNLSTSTLIILRMIMRSLYAR
jgi:hypothetical protein